MPLVLIDRPHPAWTIARANQVMHVDKQDFAAAAELAELPTLAASWQVTLRRRVEASDQPDAAKRLVGPNDS